MKPRTMIVAAALFFAAAVYGQGPMGPSEELKKFDWMVGDWSGRVSWSFPGMEGDEMMTFKNEWEGQFLKQTSKMDMMGMTVTETAFLGWDAAAKKYKSWAFTNLSAEPRIESGTLNGDRLVMVSEPWDVGMGEPFVSRATLDRKSDGEVHFTLEFRMGDAWTKAAEGTFKKK